MVLVDYGGQIFPAIAHSPWDGLQLADFVMPFFLFISGVSLALAYKVKTHLFQQWCVLYGFLSVVLLMTFTRVSVIDMEAS